ncbi:hypothetical protein Cni_G00051 [Canna indica]|uniref:Uncharacterized protein n=1 Tax=Canna indica TaxID=4628 RepID=A0AAQ3PYU6_9LILI|nr:hypothetical protein Cni_G00051 [Canna indica]
MGNCNVKGGTTVIGAGCDGGAKAEAYVSVPETIKEVKLEAPKRVKDIISSAASHSPAKASGPWRNDEAFKKLQLLPSPEKGVWRVRMAISSEQLAEILSEQAYTEDMIERMRKFANAAEPAQKLPKSKKLVADWRSQCEEIIFPC